MQATFTAYNDKSSAKRGFVRKFATLPVEQYLDQRDGKWGYSASEFGPVPTNKAPEAAVELKDLDKTELGNANAASWPKVRKPRKATKEIPDHDKQVSATPEDPVVMPLLRRDPELDAALEQHDKEGNDVKPDAFAIFALGQLGAASNKAPEPAKPVGTVKVQANRSEANGVKHPSEGTICDQVWVIAQSLSAFVAEGKVTDHSKVATLSQVVKAAEAAGINKYTARTQYARWRVFHGITGRLQTL